VKRRERRTRLVDRSRKGSSESGDEGVLSKELLPLQRPLLLLALR
jgi:hypothetical protein